MMLRLKGKNQLVTLRNIRKAIMARGAMRHELLEAGRAPPCRAW